MVEEGGLVRRQAFKRMLFTVWALPLIAVVFYLDKYFHDLHHLLKYVLIGVAITCAPFLKDLLELLTGVRFATLARNWDSLKGWQRGVIGLGVIIGVLLLFAIVVILIVLPLMEGTA